MSQSLRDWLGEGFRQLLLDAPENLMADYGDQAIYDPPIVGVADGEDPLFTQFLTVVSPRHLMPRKTLAAYAPPDADLTVCRVIAWALPFTEEVRESNRRGDLPSQMYSLARNNGGALNHALRERLAKLIADRGWVAVAPVLSKEYDAFRDPKLVFSSTWSERHVASAAGLGRFGLHAALITPVGSHVRLGSIVTNMPVEPTPRSYDDCRAPCMLTGGALCGRCIPKCPYGAISEAGFDKSRCYEMRNDIRTRFLDKYVEELQMLAAPVVKSGKRKNSYSLGCALCQCGVPCEKSMPDFNI